MFWRSVYGVIPVPVFATDNLPETTAACERGPVVFIRPRYLCPADEGLLQHELEHVRQFWLPILLSMLMSAGVAGLAHIFHFDLAFAALPLFIGLLWHFTLSRFSKTYRYWSEVRAYHIQSECYDDDRRPLFAQFIAENYGLVVTQEQALAELR